MVALRYATVMQSPRPRQLLRGLVAYWPLHEASGSRLDVVGTNALTDNNTVTGNPGPSASKLPLASQFTAANSESLSIADNVVLSTGDIDFCGCCWVYQDSQPAGFMNIFGKWHGGGINQEEYLLYYGQTANRFAFVKSSDGTSATETTVNANTFGAPSTATWYFLYFEHDAQGNRIRISVNNGALDSTATSTGVFDSTGVFRIGAAELTPASFHNGRIAGVGFWKRNLTAAEIAYLYNSGAGRKLTSRGFV